MLCFLMKSIRSMKNLIAIVVLVLMDALMPTSLIAQTQVENDIDLLSNSSHGIYWPDPDLQEALQRAVRNPQPYYFEIQNRLTPPDLVDVSTFNAYASEVDVTTLFMILRYIGTEESLDVIAHFYFETIDHYDALEALYENITDPANKPATRTEEYEQIVNSFGAVITIQQKTLEYLGKAKNGFVLKDALDRRSSVGHYLWPFIEKYSRDIAGSYPPPEAAITFSGTWLMMGLPLQPPTNNYESIFDEFTQDQPPFAWSGQGYVSEEELQVGRGYWGWSENSGDQTVIGAVIDSLTLDLMADWNLISGPSCDFDITSIDDPGGIIALPGNQGIFGWDGSYYTTTVFEPGNAYWILTTSSGRITLDCSAAPGKRAQEAIAYRPEESGFMSMQVRDAEGRSTALFIGGELPPDNRYTFALPPIPPPRAGGFDARFLSGTSLIEGNEGTVALQSNAYPVLIETAGTAQGNSLTVEELANGQVVATRTVGAGTSFEITNPAVNVLRVWIR